MKLLFALLLYICTASFIVSYDEGNSIKIIDYETCEISFEIKYNVNSATYESNLMTINAHELDNNILNATIQLTNSSDEYVFTFLDNGYNELYIYDMFKYLTIYKNNTKIGTTYVTNNNITILTPNTSYFINQDTYAHCPLPNVISYYVIVINDSVIPQNVIIGGIAVSLPDNQPKKKLNVEVIVVCIWAGIFITILILCTIPQISEKNNKRYGRLSANLLA
jgi:hypothetical protein